MLGMRPIRAAFVGVFVTLLALSASAAPVDAESARKSAERWGVRRHHARQGALRTRRVPHRVRTFRANGADAFHVVDFAGGGFAVVPADDRIVSVVAFSDSGSLKEDPKSPLWRLLNADLPRRMRRVRDNAPYQADLLRRVRDNAPYQADGSSDGRADCPQSAAEKDSVFDVRVEPLLTTHWGQEGAIFNALTPSNYPCGCVATSAAQLMRYHRFPRTSVEPRTFDCWIDGKPSPQTLLGGPYDWAAMPDRPDETAAEAVGGLCYDAGVATRMNWCAETSVACEGMFAGSLTNLLGYANAVWKRYSQFVEETNKVEDIQRAVYANLDAKCPVMLSIDLPGGGHSVVADGYGVQNGQIYTHLNFGWTGSGDAWYALPSDPEIDVVKGFVYNVFPEKTGELLTGRVVDGAGLPIAKATVTAENDEKGVRTCQTDAQGIFALNVVGDRRWIVSAKIRKYNSTVLTNDVASSTSTILQAVRATEYDFDEKTGIVGNSWGNELIICDYKPRVGFAIILK